MRPVRVLVALIALALTATLSTAPSATARVEARPGATAGAVGAVSAVTSARAETIEVTAEVVKRRLAPDRPKRLVLQGQVTPAKGPVYIQRATRCVRGACTEPEHFNFRFYRKVFLDKGAYRAVIDAPPTLRGWLWRAKVGTTYSEIWQTCTKRPQQNCTVPTRR